MLGHTPLVWAWRLPWVWGLETPQVWASNTPRPDPSTSPPGCGPGNPPSQTPQPPPGCGPGDPPPTKTPQPPPGWWAWRSPCAQTDTCENITFANFVCGGNKRKWPICMLTPIYTWIMYEQTQVSDVGLFLNFCIYIYFIFNISRHYWCHKFTSTYFLIKFTS